MTENDTTVAPKAKPIKKPVKRSRNSCGCKEKNGCKEGVCGCSVNARECSESCACAIHKKCNNFMGNSAFNSSNQSTDQSGPISNGDNDKENTGDIIPCTPPKKKRWAIFLLAISDIFIDYNFNIFLLLSLFIVCSTDNDIINPYIYSHKKRNPIFTTKDDMWPCMDSRWHEARF